MQSSNVQIFSLTRRGRTILYTVVLVFLLYFIIESVRPDPPVPHLPGTYQYFLEADFHGGSHQFGGTSHADVRFAPKDDIGPQETRKVLNELLKSYSATMTELDAETWICHGVLLGWYWNQKLMPWDTDLDVQMSLKTLDRLAQSHNMSEFHYPPKGQPGSRTFLLDINPHYTIASQKDFYNRIDARWIDTATGKYVDITAIHPPRAKSDTAKRGNLWCKDGHEYAESDIYPLQKSTLNNVNVKVPYEVAKILQAEYGKKALTNSRFHWHHFDFEKEEWIYDG